MAAKKKVNASSSAKSADKPTMNLGWFVENPDNPSVATDEDIARLAGKLKRVPLGLTAMRIAYVTDRDDAGCSGKRVVISGNKRLRVLKRAYGDDGEVPAEWFADVTAMSEAERHEFIVSANVSDGEWDVDKLLAQYDKGELAELMKADELDALLGDVDCSGEEDSKYTKKVDGLVYEVCGECPSLNELVDDEKCKTLIAEIKSASIPDDVKGFLTNAACRHLVFNYRNIAEYYAHATAEVQKLMERSGLVIVDLDSAIENGFAKFSQRLEELRGGETDEEIIEATRA